MRSFLGLAKYCRRFIKDFINLASSLFGILTKDLVFIANINVKRHSKRWRITIAPILRGPNWDFSFHIHRDAFDKVVGADLGQVEDKFPYAIYLINKNLSKVELNYTVTEKQLLVVLHSLNKFRHYITRYQVFEHSDFATIKYLIDNVDVKARIIRWLLLLKQLDLAIIDKLGKENVVALFYYLN